MRIKDISPEQANKVNKNTLMEHLDIRITELGEDYLKAQMPVDKRTWQPLGMLHGGASAALIESVASVGSSLMIDLEKAFPVGVEINANHITAVRTGTVEAEAKLVHGGKKTHVWQVDIKSVESNRLVCTGRLTVMIVERK